MKLIIIHNNMCTGKRLSVRHRINSGFRIDFLHWAVPDSWIANYMLHYIHDTRRPFAREDPFSNMAPTSTITKLLSYVAFNQVNSQLGVRNSRSLSRLISRSLIYSTNQVCSSDPKAAGITEVRRFSCFNWHGKKSL